MNNQKKSAGKISVEREKWLLLIVLSIIWGSSFILIKKSLVHYNPYEVGALRILIAGIILLPIAILNIKKFPKKQLKWLLIAAFSGNFIPMFLFPVAQKMVSSSIAGIINSMLPILVIMVGAIFWKFKTTKRQLIGVGISFSGACIIALSNGSGGNIKFFPVLLLLTAVLGYAINVTTVKSKLQGISAKILSSFVFSFVLLLPSFIALLSAGFVRDFVPDEGHFIGLGYVALLSIFGTGFAMMLNYRLLNISTPLFASTVTLLMPIVAIIWGVLDGETLTTGQIIGGIVIVSGLLFLRAKNLEKKIL
ncbi:DMT family transporter [Frigoriflavimonas asaccharolytica]|uniref:Drug/metabolite transporter (DMT)-like permease n=1 Tax=Frigoriflavimonas asaccharolytica TaxID=2735899 RepID=A0A8J8G9S7_9FLAO|nr:DMT family transporter [Frigoriflavimonas asaccharolytica]NRS93969.1 drug/metabolite transporter (DMT)-like permease [Frigoriflavimonas asaccharolytica]